MLMDKGIRGAIVALVLALLAFFGLQGCQSFGQLTPQAQRSLDLFECRAEALAPYVDEVFDAEELVRETMQGRTDLVVTLMNLGHARADVEAALAAFRACSPAPEPESPGAPAVLRV